jgi:hypothetical protein
MALLGLVQNLQDFQNPPIDSQKETPLIYNNLFHLIQFLVNETVHWVAYQSRSAVSCPNCMSQLFARSFSASPIGTTPPQPTPAFPFNVMAFPFNVMAFPITGHGLAWRRRQARGTPSNWERHSNNLERHKINWERHNIRWKRQGGMGWGGVGWGGVTYWTNKNFLGCLPKSSSCFLFDLRNGESR